MPRRENCERKNTEFLKPRGEVQTRPNEVIAATHRYDLTRAYRIAVAWRFADMYPDFLRKSLLLFSS